MAAQDSQILKSAMKVSGAYKPVGAHTQDATVSAATPISVPDGANGLIVQCTAQNVRYTLDGTTPTATTGFLMTAGAAPIILYKVDEDSVFTFIEVAASAVLIYQAVRIYA